MSDETNWNQAVSADSDSTTRTARFRKWGQKTATTKQFCVLWGFWENKQTKKKISKIPRSNVIKEKSLFCQHTAREKPQTLLQCIRLERRRRRPFIKPPVGTFKKKFERAFYKLAHCDVTKGTDVFAREATTPQGRTLLNKTLSQVIFQGTF